MTLEAKYSECVKWNSNAPWPLLYLLSKQTKNSEQQSQFIAHNIYVLLFCQSFISIGIYDTTCCLVYISDLLSFFHIISVCVCMCVCFQLPLNVAFIDLLIIVYNLISLYVSYKLISSYATFKTVYLTA